MKSMGEQHESKANMKVTFATQPIWHRHSEAQGRLKPSGRQGWDMVAAMLLLLGGAQAITIDGAGASFPDRLYQEAIFAYHSEAAANVSIRYASMGSGKGKCRIMNSTTCAAGDTRLPRVLDWAGSDSLLSASDYAAYPDLQMYPTVAGAVVPIYNLPNTSAADPDLVLTPLLLARIFRSDVTRWNDPEIATLNPELATRGKLPAARICIVVREEKSGTTEIFTKSLSSFDVGFMTQIGFGELPSWSGSNVTRLATNFGVSSYVLKTPLSVGYSVLAEALALNMRFAASKLCIAQNRCEGLSPEPTPACLQAWGAPKQSGAQPWQVGHLARPH